MYYLVGTTLGKLVELSCENVTRKITGIQSTSVISKPDITKHPLIEKCDIFPEYYMHLFSSAYNEYTVISKEYQVRWT